LKQTPLHKAALNKNWYAYYALKINGADVCLKDARNKSASQYLMANRLDVSKVRQAGEEILHYLEESSVKSRLNFG